MTERAAILAQLARLVAASAGDGDLAERLVDASRRVLGADGASLTVGDPNPSRMTLCTTDSTAARLEEVQDVVGQGPSWDAFRTQQPVVTDLGPDAENRWPDFTLAAREFTHPQTIVYAMPMRPGSHVVGVLCLYHLTPGGLTKSIDSAQFLADTVGAALLRNSDAHEGPGQPEPWSGRAEIHQATGMVISQLNLPPEDALAILRAHAYAHETTLADIARQVITRVIDFQKDDE